MTKLHTVSALWTMSPKLSADIRPVVLGSQSLLLSRIFYMSYLWTLKGCLVTSCLFVFLAAPAKYYLIADLLLPAPAPTDERGSHNQDSCRRPRGELDCLHDIVLRGMYTGPVILADTN
jgi:hypothetical protein